MATFSGFQHIGEIVFNYVPSENILNCRKVCKSWKQILDNPKLWLKKLNSIGQTKIITKDCLTLLRKAAKIGLPESTIGHCLLIKYSKVTSYHSPIVSLKFQKIKKFWLNLPLLYFALIPKVPNIELVNLILKFSKINPNRDVNFTPSPYKYLRGKLIKFTYRQYIPMYPLKDALEGNNTLEVIQLLQPEFKPDDEDDHDDYNGKHLEMAVKIENLEVCKLFVGDFKSYTFKIGYIESAISLAINAGKVDVLEFLLSKTKTAAGKFVPSPMDLIIEKCQKKKQDENHKCVEMAKILLPKVQNNINDQSNRDQKRTIMHVIVMNMQFKNSVECMISILKLVSPIADHSLKDKFGNTAMDSAKILKVEPALEVFRSLKKRKLGDP